MDTCYIIACSGEEKRWGNYLGCPKHLIKIDGERLLDRTVRLIKNKDESQILIMAYTDEYLVDGTDLYVPQRSIADHQRYPAIYGSREIWNKNGQTILLYGDVYFTEDAIATIVEDKNNGDIKFYGRENNSQITGKGYGELFAIRFSNQIHEKILTVLNKLKIKKDKGEIQRFCYWEFYRSWHNIPLTTHAIKGNFVTIDDRTDDFDFPGDYDRWIRCSPKDKPMKYRIALIMMVKNESKIIKRALASTFNLVDTYFICDTGSTDDTKEKIIEYQYSCRKTIMITDIEWKNFGYSKSIMMKEAREKCHADYFLFFDAKEVIENEQGNPPTAEDRKKLLELLDRSTASIYMLDTIYGNYTYRRWSIFRNNQLYKWKSPVHEYVDTTGIKSENIDTIRVVVRGGGNSGHGSKKYMGYAKMLKEYIDDRPNETLTREYYYIAQCYKDADRMDLAEEWYNKRIELMNNNRNEEPFVSMLVLYRHLKSKKDLQMLMYLHMMTEKFPNRLEGWYEAMMYFKDDKELAVAYGKKGYKCITEGGPRYLFLETDIYDYMFIFQYCLVAYYAGCFKEAFEASSRIKYDKAPDHIKIQHEKNISYYKSKYDSLQIKSRTTQRSYYREGFRLLPNIIIIDGVLIDPDKRRKFALDQKFEVIGNYPGKRTKPFATIEDKQMFESLLGKKITHWPDKYNGSYQYTTKEMSSWIHRDLTDYSAIIYLSPNPPIDGGTLIYMHKTTEKTLASDKNTEDIFNIDSYNESAWNILDKVGCLYNRMVIFNGKQSHRSDRYFGDTLENGRLFQVFFFNLE